MASAIIIEQWFRESLKPDPVLTVSQWADNFRVLPRKAASEPGPWRTKRTPYLEEIMDVLSVTHPSKKVVFKKGSQVGGTEAGNNWLGYIIDHVPGPTMLVLPTVDTAKRNSILRIEPLIDETPALAAKIGKIRSRDNTNTLRQKDFDGGTLMITGANSAAELKSVPCRFVMLDEVDEFPRNVEGQGDPIALVAARSRTFSRRKMFVISTPTYEGGSKIDEEFDDSDQRHFYLACPHCKHEQTLEFEQLQWTAGKHDTVLYYCAGCGVGIEEFHKTKMLSNGKWKSHNPGHKTVGFFLSALYSPIGWLSWTEIAEEYERAKKQLETEKKEELMVTFTNTILGKSYKHVGEAPEWKRLYERRETYQLRTCPENVLFLTAGVDVQKDRIEIEVVGWGKGKQSWSIDYQVFMGDPTVEGSPVWAELENYIMGTFEHESGARLPLRQVCVDSGFATQRVYNFCRKFSGNKVVPVKGDDNLSVIVALPKATDVKVKDTKRKLRRAVKVFRVGVSMLKQELYSWLKLETPLDGEDFPNGFCHFPEYDDEFFKQITAERLVLRRDPKGQIKTEWVKDRERNEALDCRNYARAAASMAGLDRFREQDFERMRPVPLAKRDEMPQSNSESERGGTKKERRKRRRESSIW